MGVFQNEKRKKEKMVRYLARNKQRQAHYIYKEEQ
jgi:hypothetical protein